MIHKSLYRTILSLRLFYKSWRPAILGWVLLIAYNDYIIHWHQSVSYWDPLIIPKDNHDVKQVRVLFVADAQIQGRQNQYPFVGDLTRWDSDRFLHATFTSAVSRLQPDVIVFLGDLLDEGSIARSPQEFEGYVRRFRGIFRTTSKIQHVYTYGDNDVGGENAYDVKSLEKIKQFQSGFDDPAVTTNQFVDFINVHFDKMFDPTKEEVNLMAYLSHAPLRVLLNHTPLLKSNTPLAQTIDIFHPQMIFVGHLHHAGLAHCPRCYTNSHPTVIYEHLTDSSRVHHLSWREEKDLLQVMVPTCNYRMGTSRMGYGAAVFSSDGHLHYTIYWLPQRYQQLYIYLLALVVTMVYGLFRPRSWR